MNPNKFSKLVGFSLTPDLLKEVKRVMSNMKKKLNYANSVVMPDETSTSPSEYSEGDHADAKMWAVYGNAYTPCEKAIPKLIPGQYIIGYNDNRGLYFQKKEVTLDELIVLPDTVCEFILAHIQDFWNKETRYRELGFLWKRGVLLWGPPGSGKTSTIQLLSSMIVERGGIAVYISNPNLAAQGLELLRRIEPTRPIVAILEDLDAIIANNRHIEADILSLIDGELQIDNIVFVATTNYPEELDKRITNRPSRFDIVREIGMPSKEAREMFLASRNERLAKPENETELKAWVGLTNGFSIAHLKEMIICVECYEQSYKDIAATLKRMIEVEIKSESGKNIGFND